MSPAAGDILAVETAVEKDRGVDPLHDIRGTRGKTTAPQGVRGGIGVCVSFLFGPIIGHIPTPAP
jgi:hypothetical protein